MEALHKALFYEKHGSLKVKCTLCPMQCIIADGHEGFCNVRRNVNGDLYSLIYNRAASIAADPIEKKPLFHFFPGSKVLSLGTYGCNMRCGHCQNWSISHDMRVDQTKKITSQDLLRLCKESSCSGVAWTYNEPTIWFEFTLEGAKLFKENGLYTVYVTNGYINLDALDMIGPYLDAFRVDIKGFNQPVYQKLCKVKHFESILRATERAKKKWGMHVEVVTNIIPGLNDDEKQLKQIAKWITQSLGVDTPWHLTRFFPHLDFKDIPPTAIETLENAMRIGRENGLKFVYLGNTPGHKGENTYCPNCQSLVIERNRYKIVKYAVEGGNCAFCRGNLNIRS